MYIDERDRVRANERHGIYMAILPNGIRNLMITHRHTQTRTPNAAKRRRQPHQLISYTIMCQFHVESPISDSVRPFPVSATTFPAATDSRQRCDRCCCELRIHIEVITDSPPTPNSALTPNRYTYIYRNYKVKDIVGRSFSSAHFHSNESGAN